MTATAVTTVYTLANWNALLAQITGLGCANLPPVTAPHIWTVADIKAAQAACSAGPTSGAYTTPAGPANLWQQKIIDELNQAIAAGCCCNVQANNGQKTMIGSPIPATVIQACGGNNPPETQPLAPLINGMTVGPPNIAYRSWGVFSSWVGAPSYIQPQAVAAGSVSCNGQVQYSGTATIATVNGIFLGYGGSCSDPFYLGILAQNQAAIAAGGQLWSPGVGGNPPVYQPPGWFPLQYFLQLNTASGKCVPPSACKTSCGCNCTGYGVYLYTGPNNIYTSCACGTYAQVMQIAANWKAGTAAFFQCNAGGGSGGGNS